MPMQQKGNTTTLIDFHDDPKIILDSSRFQTLQQLGKSREKKAIEKQRIFN